MIKCFKFKKKPIFCRRSEIIQNSKQCTSYFWITTDAFSWCKRNRLYLNIDKSECKSFFLRRTLTRATNIRDLGIIFDQNMSSASRITTCPLFTSQTVRLLYTKWKCPVSCLLFYHFLKMSAFETYFKIMGYSSCSR